MSRQEQINEMLKIELAQIVNQEIFLENALITISYVDCSPDFKNAKIGVSILPENMSGTALSKLRNSSSRLAKFLKKQIRLRKIPKFIWIIDETEKNAAKIDKIFKQINKEK